MSAGTWPELPPLVREAQATAESAGFSQSCSPETGRLLHTLAAQVRVGRIGELGSGSGVGTAWLASALDPAVDLVTVESDETLAGRVGALFDDLGNVTALHGDWTEIAGHAPFGLLFCDTVAPKREQIDATIGLLLPGGTIVLDDYTGIGRVDDPERDAWLHHPHLVATELLVSATAAVVMGVRR